MDLYEAVQGGMDSTDLTQDRDRWQAAVNVFRQMWGIFQLAEDLLASQ
jgi:hypothetical protein